MSRSVDDDDDEILKMNKFHPINTYLTNNDKKYKLQNSNTNQQKIFSTTQVTPMT